MIRILINRLDISSETKFSCWVCVFVTWWHGKLMHFIWMNNICWRTTQRKRGQSALVQGYQIQEMESPVLPLAVPGIDQTSGKHCKTQTQTHSYLYDLNPRLTWMHRVYIVKHLRNYVKLSNEYRTCWYHSVSSHMQAIRFLWLSGLGDLQNHRGSPKVC